MAKFKVNDTVEWTSQANGVAIRKRGKIVGRVRRGEDANDVAKRLKKRVSFKVSKKFGGPRDHASFFVLVPGDTPNQTPQLYWPKVDYLNR